jgi:hypothetical protein
MFIAICAAAKTIIKQHTIALLRWIRASDYDFGSLIRKSVLTPENSGPILHATFAQWNPPSPKTRPVKP